MAVFQRTNNFFADLNNGLNDPGLHAMRLGLTNVLPLVTQSRYNQITEIVAGAGYVAGGYLLVVASSVQVAGLYTLILQNFQIIAGPGSMSPWRWAVIYDSNTGSLMGFADYGSTIALNAAELVNVQFDQVNGILQGGP